jgi:hypothetical protein
MLPVTFTLQRTKKPRRAWLSDNYDCVRLFIQKIEYVFFDALMNIRYIGFKKLLS